MLLYWKRNEKWCCCWPCVVMRPIVGRQLMAPQHYLWRRVWHIQQFCTRYFYSQGRQTMTFLVKLLWMFWIFQLVFLSRIRPIIMVSPPFSFPFLFTKKLYHYELPFTVQNMYAKNSVSLCWVTSFNFVYFVRSRSVECELYFSKTWLKRSNA